MYRGVTALALDRGIDPRDEPTVSRLARQVRFSFPALSTAEAVNPPLLADGVDITSQLRLPDVDRNVSAVSSYAAVREAMVAQQRAIAHAQSVVMVGRDIGTVVLSDADVKVFLTASVEERAVRRNEERRAAGIDELYATTLADLQRRDRLDSERPISPLRPADDAIPVDTTGLQPEQSAALVRRVVQDRLAALGLL
jgi:cytidylate kinase